ncbi:glycosyltransferase [Micromonospora sp. RTGN7]|uniref:glycosyltransferase n=1 Tax=Micromonospora sp. RTGN7 TaxID=3016526 RepID=UPI0029FF51DA|nr:glycosyltransferase [Micromonospora sp. RTGN7]
MTAESVRNAPVPSQRTVLLDIAGSEIGGAARWRAELEQYLAARPDAATVVGQGRRITSSWLLRRERLAHGYGLVVAPNNLSFAISGTERRLLLRNALHFLYPSERHLLARMPRAFQAKIPVVRRLVARADLVVVPCSAMAERVVRRLPAVGPRLVVRPHPVTPVGPRCPTETPTILVPVVPGPYKNLVPQLRILVGMADRVRYPARILVTAAPASLPADLREHERIEAVGIVPHDRLAQLWRTATAAFYPSVLESFGYPLAEARAYGVPVLAPVSSQSVEIAGLALRGYEPNNPRSLGDALARIAEPVVAEPRAFDRDDYFDFLLTPGS